MTYTALAVTGVVVAVVVDRLVARTRITSTKDWWLAYAIIVFFQLLTNGWLTGRQIVSYDPDQIVGNERVVLLGEGRILFDGRDVTLDETVMVIADGVKPLALAGVMGGDHSGIGADTTDVLLEVAFFLPDAIAGRWSENDEHRAPMDHLRAAFDGRRRESLTKHMRHYLRPVGWVEKLWRE